ncbi:tetratricopeptide repeat protein [Blastopirellula marina]|uniref:Outer membrane lipoprotein BamD-like domain-containing protein n=1 Tax=Blastopirellula marina TaxID=124 RepID=A0A2S8FCS7_9BACT|nr:hypothetical protein [Blastopirellula marina]PQO29932.1 hypothetical protein C5Y98_21965 [Blastopirellula marina]PTL42400.1 hypothetical protein C5Y97_21975 [Blastopirellula marina]
MRIFRQSLLAFALLLAVAPLAHAEEPFNEFFDGLLQRGYYDQAIWYVDSMANNSSLPADVKNTLLYRKGRAQFDASWQISNLEQRGTMLADAAKNLAEFLKQQPENDRAIDATIQQGNVISAQAKLAIALAQRETTAVAKEPYLKQAREKFAEARKIFEDANTQIRDALTKLGKVLDPSKDGAKIAFRDEMRASYIQTQMLASNCLLESAKTLDDKSADRKKQLEQAAKEFGETYSKYKTRLAGLYARLYEGQAQQALDKDKEAISIYQDDLMLLPDQPEQFRRVKLKAAIGLSTIWLKQEAAPKVVNELAPWLASQQLRPIDQRDPEWLELRYLVAKAYLDDAAALGSKDKSYSSYRKEALKLAIDIAKHPGQFQEPAVEMRAELQGSDAVAQEKPEPKTFQEAVTAGRDLITKANTQQQIVISKLKKDLESTQDDAAKQELTSQLEKEEKSVQEAYAQAKPYFQQALRLADPDTPRDEINSVQYYLSFLAFQDGEYWQTFARATFIAEHYPNSSSAQSCSKMALASAHRLFESAPDDQRAFELSLVERATNFIVRQWPTSSEAGQAQLALVGLQLQQASSKDIPWQQQKALVNNAESIVAKMADGDATKADAQLRVGQTYWSLFSRGKALNRAAGADSPDAKDAPTDKDLTAVKQKAETILAAGVNNFKGKEADYTYVIGAISLAQVYTDVGKPNKAVELLEKPKLGLISLVEADNKAATIPAVEQFIHKAAVRAYISALSVTQDPAKTEAMMANAEKAMGKLKDLAGNDANSQKELIAIYISLATDLKQQLDNADPSAKESLGAAFETFLDRLADSSNEPNVLNWVGETFYNVGQSFSEDPSYMGDASKFYKKAISAYQRILDKSSGGDINPALLQQVRVRIAMAQRETGQYEEALATFTDVLKQNDMIVNVQVEAAKTYYLWGLNGGDAKTFYQSWMGASPNPETKKNVIWGWGRLQSILGRYAKRGAEPSPYKDVFYESRYYLAASRYRFAIAQDNQDKKQQYLAVAAKDITSTQLFDPGLGGEQWWTKFDTLMKKIQKDLTGTAKGLDKK